MTVFASEEPVSRKLVWGLVSDRSVSPMLRDASESAGPGFWSARVSVWHPPGCESALPAYLLGSRVYGWAVEVLRWEVRMLPSAMVYKSRVLRMDWGSPGFAMVVPVWESAGRVSE